MTGFYEDRNYANALLNDDQHFQDIEARALAQEKRDKQISNDRAMADVMKIGGLSNSELLFEFYQKRFTSIGNEPVPFEQDRLKKLTGLLGLVIDRFLILKLPVPEKWQTRLLADYYTLSDVKPWADFYSELAKTNDEYSRYTETWVDLKVGRKDYQRNVYSGKKEEIYFNPDYELRLKLGQEYATLFLDRLKELLGLDKKSSVLQVLQRNVNLKDLVAECNRYPAELSSIMHAELKDECEKLKGDDPLSKLCADSITGALYSSDFDIDQFQNSVIQILWQELVDSQKTDSQKDMVEIIRRQISGEVYSGIQEVE